MKKIFIFIALILTLVSCNIPKDTNEITEIKENNENQIEKLNITTSILPLASITSYIGGEFVKATSLVPAGVSPHGFDIKPNQMINLEKSDLIVYLGLEHIDGFLNKAIENKDNILSVNKGIEFLESTGHEDHNEHYDEHEEENNEHHDEHEKENDEHHDEETHSTDPHIWSNGENAYIIAQTILSRLSTIQPENKDYFETNFELFKKELDLAKNDFNEKTKEKKLNNFIVFHDAYNYLFKEFDIANNKKHIFRNNMLSDPHSREMKELIDEIKNKGIKVAFKEPQLDSSNLKQVSLDYGLKIYILDPLGTSESSNGYIDNYKNNLKSLEKIYE